MRLICYLLFFAFLQLTVLAFRRPRPGELLKVVRDFPVPRLEKHNHEDARNKRVDGTAPNTNKREYREAAAKLTKALFSGYDAEIFPGAPTEVQLKIHYQCASYDEPSRVLSSATTILLTWTDERLQWNPKEFNDVNVLRVPSYRVWTPDIKLYNGIEPQEGGWTNILIYSSGEVISVPELYFKTYCNPNGDKSARCEVKFGSWTYDSSSLPLTKDNKEDLIDTTSYMRDCPYNITNDKVFIETKHYECCPEPYHSFHATFDVKKN